MNVRIQVPKVLVSATVGSLLLCKTAFVGSFVGKLQEHLNFKGIVLYFGNIYRSKWFMLNFLVKVPLNILRPIVCLDAFHIAWLFLNDTQFGDTLYIHGT